MTTIDELNGVYSFKDAVKTVQNILHDERGALADMRINTPWEEYEAQQKRVEAIEDILTALSFEYSIMHHINAIEDREA